MVCFLREFSGSAAGAATLPFSGGTAIVKASDYRINGAIRAPKVRLIGPNGDNLGVVSRSEALQIARAADLDLVEVAPNANPPVCRVMDFGKFLYERSKKERQARKSQAKTEVKELRLRPKTSEHHREFKVRSARKWLEKGMKVRVRILFRGREITYPEIALEDLKEVAQALADVAVVEKPPALEGRSMLMILAPATKKKK